MNICDTCIQSVADGETRCSECRFYLDHRPNEEHYREELERFLSARRGRRVVFALSGGLDSVVALHKLCGRAAGFDVDILPVTIDYGLKGETALRNVREILAATGLSSAHRAIDISSYPASQLMQKEFEGELTTVEAFAAAFQRGTIPCGRLCNSIIDDCYRNILSDLHEQVLITGGDTPVLGRNGFSIFWEKDGFTVLRGGFALGGTKLGNHRYVEEHHLVWIDPGCGGNDTDCLIPGAIKRRILGVDAEIPWKRALREFPNSLSYFAPRVRYGIIERDTALQLFCRPEVNSDSCYREFLAALEKRVPGFRTRNSQLSP